MVAGSPRLQNGSTKEATVFENADALRINPLDRFFIYFFQFGFFLESHLIHTYLFRKLVEII